MRALVALCLLVGACASAPPPADTSGETMVILKHGCDVTVSFGSYGMGVDQELKARVLAFVEDGSDAAAWPEDTWGREGESSLCILTDTVAATNRLYDGIVALIPPYSTRAPTMVTHIDGRTHASRMPPESGQ